MDDTGPGSLLRSLIANTHAALGRAHAGPGNRAVAHQHLTIAVTAYDGPLLRGRKGLSMDFTRALLASWSDEP